MNINYNSSVPIDELVSIFPKLKDQVIPLSVTAVTPRAFFHWKENGVVDYPGAIDGKRERIRLNIFQYVWVMVCKYLRRFGVPLEVVRQVKNELFSDAGASLASHSSEVLKKLSDKDGISPEYTRLLRQLAPTLEEEYKKIEQQYKVFTTGIGIAVCAVLFFQKQVGILFSLDEEDADLRVFSYGSVVEYHELMEKYLARPHLIIPLREIVGDFFRNTKNEKYIEKFELLTTQERQIMQAVRKLEFEELIIKRNAETGQLKLERMKSKDVKGEKAGEIIKMLGMSEYDEVTLKFRNGQHVYVQSRSKLIKRPGSPGSK
jgi:hypothetical protein